MKVVAIKKTGLFFLIILLVGSGWKPVFAAKEPDSRFVPASFSQLAEEARPGVVNIRTVKTIKGGGRVFRHFFGNPFEERNPFGPYSEGEPGPDFKQRSLGSGFIIDREGYIVTNNHVIEDADQIKVRLAGGKEYDARVVGRDPNTDLALIKIEAAVDLTPLPLGDSEKLPIGSWVVAIGSPFGLEQTVTAGIVSAKGRIIGSGPYDDFIQTDASINPGNSGGPLLNLAGEVVGINTAIVAQGQGIGFAIPVNSARGIIAQLKEHGEVTRGWLGVGIQDLTPELAEYYGIKDQKGVLVTEVFKGDPADPAGIKPKDVIIAVDEKPVDSARDLSTAVAGIPAGRRTKITFIREGREQTAQVEITKRKDAVRAAEGPATEKGNLGLEAGELTAETARQFGHSEDDSGVVVLFVEPGSKAQAAGFREGDLVKELNRKVLARVKDLRDGWEQVPSGENARFLIKRPNAGFVVLTIGK
jgi:serine protease Do